MRLVDGHMHLEYGPLKEEYVLEFVKEAEKKGLSEIQILDHTHRFKEFEKMYEPLKKYREQKEWLENRTMKFHDTLSDYVKLMKKIQTMDLPVKVKYGLEVCYTEDSEELIKEVLSHYPFDFIVGAVHSIDGILYDMPFSNKLLWDSRDVDEIYRHYYRRVINLIYSGLFSQLAHPDTIKMANRYPTYDLKDTYEQMADALLEKGMLAEDNVGCTYRYHHKDLGLSDELLEIFIRKKVPLITASDGHHPEDVGTLIKEASEKIEKMKEKINE